MSKVQIKGNASGTGIFTIAAPNTNTDYSITLPTSSAELVTTNGASFTGNVAIEKSANTLLTITETGAGAVSIQGTGSGGRVYSNASYKLLLGANGQNSHLTIDTAGNVGIGTTSPSSLLSLESGIRNLDFTLADSPASGDAGVQITAGAGDYLGLYAGTSNGELLLGSNGTERMRINSSGNVKINNHLGIGADPHSTRPLRVSQDATNEWIAEFINTGTSPYGVYIDTSANSSTAAAFQIYANSGGGIKIRNDSLVGIGTTSPDTKLHIAADNGNAEVEALRLTNSDNTFTNGETEQAISLGFELNASEAGVREDRLAAKIVARKGGSGGNDWYTNAASTNFQGQLDFYTRKDDTLTKQMTLNEAGSLMFNSGYGSVATVYGCRAWVNFNGVSGNIRESGNVSSITDNGTGLYTVNFSSSMPSTDYSPYAMLKPTSGATSTNGKSVTIKYDASLSTSNYTLWCNSTAGNEDFEVVSTGVFR